MLVKGVTGGKAGGAPIEYSPEEKFPLAVKKFLADKSPEGKMYMFCRAEFEKKDFNAKGIPSAKGYANNVYLASGKVWYKVFDVNSDKLFPEKSQDFSIEFKDSLDSYGLPEIELVDLTLE